MPALQSGPYDEEVRAHLNSVQIRPGNFRTTCPLCSHLRKKNHLRTFSVRIEDGKAKWFCHHCNEKGYTRLENDLPWMSDVTKPALPIKAPASLHPELTEDQLKYLASRSIDQQAAERCGLVGGNIYIRSRGQEVLCIGFPYKNHDGTTAIKWRDALKNYTQTGVANSLWRIEEFKGGDLIITEGEMDALSYEQIDVLAVSVPNGAVQQVSSTVDSSSKKFAYLYQAESKIKKAERILISTDNDGPGDALAEEIARRIGKSRCWRVRYPEGCKDANEVLCTFGAQALRKALDEATPWPIGGLREAIEYEEQAVQLFRDGMDHAIDLKVGDLSRIYKPSPGTLVVVTGIPGSGKSTFLTWLSYLLADRYQWPCAVFAAETTSQVHLLQLAALRTNKPFMGPGKMTEKELREAIHWIDSHFVFLDESETSVESILERAQAAVLRNGCRVLMIDPFNFVAGEYGRSDDDGSTQAINRILVRLKSFAVEHEISVWLVAHPKKMDRIYGKNATPGGYDISGSAHFFNVADNGLTLERDAERDSVAHVVSWKSRFAWIGAIGRSTLSLDRHVGCFDRLREWGDSPKDYVLPENATLN